MRTLINSLHPDDYNDLVEENHALLDVCHMMQGDGLNIEIPHHHRYWEYSTALKMIIDKCNESMTAGTALSEFTIMDIGSGHGLLGPALSCLYNINVTECEPVDYQDRILTNSWLEAHGHKQLKVIPCDTDNLPNEQFNMVSCISVIEHMHLDVETRCWKNLVDRVKPSGLLFISVDCVEDQNVSHVYDSLRVHNFTIPELKIRIEHLIELGMVPIGEPDYNWNGAQVFDYSFFRIGMKKL